MQVVRLVGITIDQTNKQKEAVTRGVAVMLMVPSFSKKQSEEHSLVLLTRMTMKKNEGEATLMVSSFVCWLNLLVNQKEGAQKQRGHLVAQDASCSFSVPIC